MKELHLKAAQTIKIGASIYDEMEYIMRHLLPPIGALHSFLAAARRESITLAADEVRLTQSAVSRQIQQLEQWLGTPLFERSGRRVVLTASGRAYAAEIGPALDSIRRATGRMMNGEGANMLTIATLPSFGMRWLASRLPRLTEEHPEIIVNLSARSLPFDFALEAFDAAIHYGKPDWPRAQHHLLFRDRSIAVCSPEWLARHPLRRPEDLLDAPRLTLTSRPDAWNQWFASVDVPVGRAWAMPNFEHFLMMAQAAAAGAGAALIPTFLIEAELASGALVAPFDQGLETGDAYYVVHPEGQVSAALAGFLRWIEEEAGGA
jgi:LysR family glycine cleavage system transcriptional activator